MVQIIKSIFYFGPLIFGIGFLAPLLAQIAIALEWTIPFGVSPIVFGLTVGFVLGLIAQIRGRWV